MPKRREEKAPGAENRSKFREDEDASGNIKRNDKVRDNAGRALAGTRHMMLYSC